MLDKVCQFRDEYSDLLQIIGSVKAGTFATYVFPSAALFITP